MLSDGGTDALANLRVARLNAPYGARCFLTTRSPVSWLPHQRLNAPYGARCFLTFVLDQPTTNALLRLNAPYGARCFLTIGYLFGCELYRKTCLNAPYGARCFLTGGWPRGRVCEIFGES